jgi:hypothetical protein
MASFHGTGHVLSGYAAVPATNRRGTSAQLTAVLDALLDIHPRRTALDIEEFAVVDGMLFARAAGEGDFRHYLGPRVKLIETLDRLTLSRAISPRERAYLIEKLGAVADVCVTVDDEEV